MSNIRWTWAVVALTALPISALADSGAVPPTWSIDTGG